jgi:hypothetical protein
LIGYTFYSGELAMRRLVGFFLLSVPFLGHAQDQLALRLNEQGLVKILQLAAEYNTGRKNAHSVVIPQNLYKFTIPRSQLMANPVVRVVNEITNLELSKDLDFFLNTSNIKIDGRYDPRSIRTQIINSNSRGFDLRLTLNVPEVAVSTPNLSLCEDQLGNTKRCGGGLRADLAGLELKTSGRPAVITAVLRLRTDGNFARVRVVSVDSNLESNQAPTLNINFRSLTIPPLAISIDGQRTELDTSRLREEILRRRVFLGKKLLAFVADFIASDVAEMVNVYLVNQQIQTSYLIFQRNTPLPSLNEFVRARNFIAVADKTYVRPPIRLENMPLAQPDPISLMLKQISEVIRNAYVDISLGRISTPLNKDIEVSGVIGLLLNNRAMGINNRLGNSGRQLPALDLNSHRQHDINLAISEPLLNGALDLVSSTGLFQELFDTFAGTRGFSIRNVKVHFTSGRSVIVVVNSSIDLKRLRSSSPLDWLKKRIAVYLERNNNNSMIYFPI